MIAVRVDYDIYQVFGPIYSPRRRANKELVIVAKLIYYFVQANVIV